MTTALKKLLQGIAVIALFAGPANWIQTRPAVAQSQTLPNVADLADRVLPSVVEIAVEQKAPDAIDSAPDSPTTPKSQPAPDDSPFKDFFDDFLNKRGGQGGAPKQNRVVTGMGSGFIVDATGLIVTNNHVVEGAEGIEVHLQDSTILEAELVGRDPKTDIAVIRVKPTTPLKPLSFGNSDTLRIGEWVMAIGNPFGLGGSVSLGIVSARNRDINAGPYDDFIQTDAAINKGNSGGPLFNMNGEVVGMNTAIFSPSGGSVGIGFSVPSNTVNNVVGQLVKFGETRRGWLGVKLQAITDDIADSMNIKGVKGALVADVTPDGPSAKGGMLAGDVIIEFDGKPITDMRSLPRAVGETDVGKRVAIKVNRKGQIISLEVELGRLEDVEKKAEATTTADSSAVATSADLGMTFAAMTDELRTKFKIEKEVKGVVVTDVAAQGPAADKKMQPGDVIIEAGGKRVDQASQVMDGIEAAKKAQKSSMLFLIAKAGKAADTRFFALKLKK
jgi:serine protease Do